MKIRYEEVEFKTHQRALGGTSGKDEGGKQGKFIFDTDTRMLRVSIPGKKPYDTPAENTAAMYPLPEPKAETKRVA